MSYHKSYKSDPYWTTAKFNSIDQNGKTVLKGTRIFYYPKCKTVLQGAEADEASARFQSEAADEDFMNRGAQDYGPEYQY